MPAQAESDTSPTKPAAPRGRKPMKETAVVHIRLSNEAIERLDQLAESNGTNRSAIVAIAVTKLLKTGI